MSFQQENLGHRSSAGAYCATMKIREPQGVYTMVPGIILKHEGVRPEGEEERKSDDKVNGCPLINKVARATVNMPPVEILSCR